MIVLQLRRNTTTISTTRALRTRRQTDAIGMKDNNDTTSCANADAMAKTKNEEDANTVMTYLSKQKPIVLLEQCQSTDSAIGSSNF
uniref:Uncharacterized protein n=1 Tax=Daphnia magna TaxID=35525 RepID=A0A0P6FGR0_9CRUS